MMNFLAGWKNCYFKSKTFFTWLDANEHPNYPNGIQDNTHFCETGAREVGKIILEGIGTAIADCFLYKK